jgi:hypothetical protein
LVIDLTIHKNWLVIDLRIHKNLYYKVRVSTGSVETRWLGSIFVMVCRNNAGRLVSGCNRVCALRKTHAGSKRVSCARTTLCWFLVVDMFFQRN